MKLVLKYIKLEYVYFFFFLTVFKCHTIPQYSVQVKNYPYQKRLDYGDFSNSRKGQKTYGFQTF